MVNNINKKTLKEITIEGMDILIDYIKNDKLSDSDMIEFMIIFKKDIVKMLKEKRDVFKKEFKDERK